MDFKHNSASLTNQPKDRVHESGLMESMCWCMPIRSRFNALTGNYEVWDKDKFDWVYDTDALQSDEFEEDEVDHNQPRTPGHPV